MQSRLATWLFSHQPQRDRGLRRLWGLWVTMWFLYGIREAAKTSFRLGYLTMKRRFYLAGDESRTTGHEAYWIAVMGIVAGIGALLRFANHGADHTYGWVLIGIAAYIGLAFFLPLWLPRVRDAELIKERRRQDREALENTKQLMRRALEDYQRKETKP